MVHKLDNTLATFESIRIDIIKLISIRWLASVGSVVEFDVDVTAVWDAVV